MSAPLLCGIDAGTGSIRAMLVEPDGGIKAVASRPTPTTSDGEDRAHHDAEALWRATLEALADAAGQIEGGARRISGIVIASMGEAGVLIDGKGTALCPMIAWYDNRTRPAFDRLTERLDHAFFFERCGLCPDPTFTVAKWAWLRQHHADAWQSARHWLHVSDYLAFRLCGEIATDLSLASRTMALDLAACRWSNDILSALEINPARLPPIRPSGEALGPVRSDIATSLGLDPACTVAIGGHDHICGMLAIGANRPGHLLDSMGTAEGLTLTVPRPVFKSSILASGLNQGVIQVKDETPAHYVFGGLPTSAAAIDWFRRALGANEPIEALIDAASAVPPGAGGTLFFPQLRLGSPPHPDHLARGGFAGISPATGKAALFRAVLEGVALDGAQILDCIIDQLAVAAPERITAIGGSTQNRLLMAIKAALVGREIEVSQTHDATALGAAMLAGLASGLYANLDEAQKAIGIETATVVPLAGWNEADRHATRRAYAAGKSMFSAFNNTTLSQGSHRP
jgi:xylulokinase